MTIVASLIQKVAAMLPVLKIPSVSIKQARSVQRGRPGDYLQFCRYGIMQAHWHWRKSGYRFRISVQISSVRIRGRSSPSTTTGRRFFHGDFGRRFSTVLSFWQEAFYARSPRIPHSLLLARRSGGRGALSRSPRPLLDGGGE